MVTEGWERGVREQCPPSLITVPGAVCSSGKQSGSVHFFIRSCIHVGERSYRQSAWVGGWGGRAWSGWGRGGGQAHNAEHHVTAAQWGSENCSLFVCDTTVWVCQRISKGSSLPGLELASNAGLEACAGIRQAGGQRHARVGHACMQ